MVKPKKSPIRTARADPSYSRYRFYVGARSIAAAFVSGEDHDHTHDTVDGAIADAQHVMQVEDLPEAIVVEIIRVIRRVHAPVVVEVVGGPRRSTR